MVAVEPMVVPTTNLVKGRIVTSRIKNGTERIIFVMNPTNRFRGRFGRIPFESVIFSGVYERKCDEGLREPSGYVCLDFDHVDVKATRELLMGLEMFETVLMFRSPSGHGVKWVVNNKTLFNHKAFYVAVYNYLKETHHLVADLDAADLSHGCLLPWDPDVYINPNFM
jgi:hypothetical protein